MKRYLIRPAAAPPPLAAAWTDPAWQTADTAEIDCFRPESSDHRPRTRVKLLRSPEGLSGLFQVEDRYVRCVRTEYFSEVWKDSCVEFFVQPRPDAGYFNFEFNCGGAFLCSYITDPTRTPSGFKEFVKLPWEVGRLIQARSSLPRTTDPELPGPLTWTLGFFIPFRLMERYVGAVDARPGREWRGNFYKCAEDLSHPHWASWSPVDEFNFHRPPCFGILSFA